MNRISANEFDKDRPIAAAGLAKLVDDVKKYAPPIQIPPAKVTTVARAVRTQPWMTRSSPMVASTSENHSAPGERTPVERTTGGESMTFAQMAPRQPPTIWATTWSRASLVLTVPRRRSTRVTTGLKWAPETAPSMRISPITAAAVPFIEMSELDAQNRRLQWIEPAVATLNFIHIFYARAVIAQHADAVGDFWIIGRDRAAIAHRAKILAGIKTPGDGVAVRADALSLIARAMGLGGVLQHVKLVFAGNRKDRIEISGLAIKMHRQDNPRAGRDRRLDQLRVYIECALVRLNGNWRRAALAYSEPSGDVSIRRHDDFIARRDAERAQGEMQGGKTIGDADGEFRLAIGRELRLEGVDLRPKNIPAAIENAPDSPINVRLQFEIRFAKIEEGNMLHLRPCAAR